MSDDNKSMVKTDRQQLPTVEFVHRKRYQEITGVSHNVVSNWMKRWERNKHYVVLGKQTMLNLHEVDEWIKTSGLNTSRQKAEELKSEKNESQ